MKKAILLLLTIASISMLNSCDEDLKDSSNLNYVTFSQATYNAGVDPNGSTTLEIPVYSANISGSDRSFEIAVDDSSTGADGSYQVPAAVTIPGGSNEGILSVVLSDVNLGIGINTLVLNFQASEGLFTGDPTTVRYVQNCTEVTGTLDIVFDGYGAETAWEITDALGGVVISKDIETYANGQASVSEPITLCSGREYTFTIYDDYGDGLSFPANGSYVLTIGGDVKASGGGDFGLSESTDFDTN